MQFIQNKIMQFTAEQLSEVLRGRIIGDPSASVSNFSKIEETTPNTLSFIGNAKYKGYLASAKASVIIINEDLLPDDNNYTSTLIVVKDAHQAFIELMRIYNSAMHDEAVGLSENAFIDKSAKCGKDCYIGVGAVISSGAVIGDGTKIFPQVFIGKDVTVGKDSIIYAGVKVYNGCQIGDRCYINSGTVIGADGFGYTQENGINIKVPQLGNVVIEDDVEIGANCTIDKATLGSTIIRKGVKMDNLIQIAHNVEIGENTVIASQTGVAGSTKIGYNCMIGGQVGIIDHITIGNNVKIIAQSGVMHDIKDDELMMGAPAFNFSDYKRSYACFRRLPDKLRKLEDEAKNRK